MNKLFLTLPLLSLSLSSYSAAKKESPSTRQHDKSRRAASDVETTERSS